MLRHRVILLVLSLLLVVGSLSGTLAYALHLRSDGYRRATEEDLSSVLNMPVAIGRIVPLSFYSSAFDDVRTWLPHRRSQVFACDRAIWREIPREQRTDYALEIHNGWFLVGTGSWSRADYEAILQSGLGHDFGALGLTEIHLDNIDFKWDHPDFHLSAKGADGVVLFDEDGTGRAVLVSRRLNDFASHDPIGIHATFVPGAGIRFDEVVLDVPRIPLRTLGLERLLAGEVTSGTFAGHVVYRENEQRVLNLSGSVEDASLAELTRRVIGGPFEGLVNVALDEASFLKRRLSTLRFRGRLDDLQIGSVYPLFGSPGVGGRVSLDVDGCEYRDGHVARFSATGRADDLPLATVTRMLGFGEITGSLAVRIHSLVVADDKVRSADVDLIATPPTDGPGTIDRAVIQSALQQLFGIDASAVLPERVEYTRLGAKLLLSGERLTIRGTHGSDGQTVLTIKVAGHEWGVIKQPDRTFEVGDLAARVRRELEQYDFDALEEWWTRQHEHDE